MRKGGVVPKRSGGVSPLIALRDGLAWGGAQSSFVPTLARIYPTLLLVSLMYIRYTGCPRSGQPLPEPRAALNCAVDVPTAPLLLHRQI